MQQSTQSVFMVSPTSFGFNEENSDSNTFQHRLATANGTVQHAAQVEFDRAVELLRAHGVNVVVYTDSPKLPKPDAVFPNNWFTTWPDGSVYLYPMAAHNRRLERAPGVVEELRRSFEVGHVEDLSAAEQHGHFLEGTGAMVFDHINRIVYACVSNRCDPELAASHARQLGYQSILFHAFDTHGAPIYHTNVMMSIHTATAIVCFEAITDPHERSRLEHSLASAKHQVITITQAQLAAFCANTLELRSNNGRLLVLSQTARAAFTPAQLELLSHDKQLLSFEVSTIEQVGGGGIRCMLAEIFLPRKTAS